MAGCKGKAKLKSKVDMRYGAVRLMPGAAAAEIGEIMERGYQEYLEFKKLLEGGGLAPAPMAARVAGSEGATKCEGKKPSH